jgi:hypothetical protein
MNDEPRRRRRDMSRILWGLLPVAIFFVAFFDLPIWAVAVMGGRPCTSGQARADASGLFVITAARVAFGGANDGKIVG